MSPEKHTVIFIPGLGDEKVRNGSLTYNAVNSWGEYGFNVLIHPVLWRNGEAFEPKFSRLLALIDQERERGKVSLVGASAGASMAFNAFSEKRTVVHRAVNICGRLRSGSHTIRSLDRMARTSIAFKQSVMYFQRNELQLSTYDRNRLMTIRPFFGDQLVPRDTASLNGANNTWIYTPEHSLTIILSLLFPGPILSFLKSSTPVESP